MNSGITIDPGQDGKSLQIQKMSDILYNSPYKKHAYSTSLELSRALTEARNFWLKGQEKAFNKREKTRYCTTAYQGT